MLADPPPKLNGNVSDLVVVADSATLKTKLLPSTTLLSDTPGAPGSTVVMVGLSLSRMPPVALTPPMLKGTDSGEVSTKVSSTVGRVTANVDTPAGTVMRPVVGLKVTPLLNVGVP